MRDDGEHHDYRIGDAADALASAAVTVDEWYETPTQHHNPIELFATQCSNGAAPISPIHEPSQNAYGMQANGLAAADRRRPDSNVRMSSRKFIGGAFGSKGGR